MKAAARIGLENREELEGVTKRLYPAIAKECRTSAGRVEHAIRHAIHTSWEKGDVNYKGNRMDMGGHRFFSKVPEVNAWWEQMLPMQGAPAADDIMLQRDVPLEKGGPDPQKEDRVMLNRNRVSRIYFDQKFYDYPIQLKPELFMILVLFSRLSLRTRTPSVR